LRNRWWITDLTPNPSPKERGTATAQSLLFSSTGLLLLALDETFQNPMPIKSWQQIVNSGNFFKTAYSMAQQIKVGLVGFGMTAQVMHAPFLKTLPQYQVTAVVERHSEKSKALFDDITVVKSLDALLERTDVDVVVITTPNDSHFDFAKKPYSPASM
jgi:hypothetical protein